MESLQTVRSVSATCTSARERRMATGEDQPQHVVIDHRRRLGGCVRVELELVHERLLLAAEDSLPPDTVDRPVCGRH